MDKKSSNTEVQVGILCATEIEFIMQGDYFFNKEKINGKQHFTLENGSICWQNKQYKEVLFIPSGEIAEQFIEIQNVTIGINFHWERKENQRFRGAIKIIPILEESTNSPCLQVINSLPIEEYLLSVISSEMSATASLELLKAHAVISRSWLLAQITNRKVQSSKEKRALEIQIRPNQEPELIYWWDHENHTLFDVCADDHCQRYQGITRAHTPEVERAIQETWGEVLTYEGKLCDARFSKCCGGEMELFSSCWENKDFPYLLLKKDPFCENANPKVLRQVLNNYDQETSHYYRWEVRYSAEELNELIHRRLGEIYKQEKEVIDLGDIINLEAVERSPSGRLIRLRIVGNKNSLIVGKELLIRRLLSNSHLYSAAFEIERVFESQTTANAEPIEFILKGKGWGHGVGLCQIGAAVMAEEGYDYLKILAHYYPHSQLSHLN